MQSAPERTHSGIFRRQDVDFIPGEVAGGKHFTVIDFGDGYGGIATYWLTVIYLRLQCGTLRQDVHVQQRNQTDRTVFATNSNINVGSDESRLAIRLGREEENFNQDTVRGVFMESGNQKTLPGLDSYLFQSIANVGTFLILGFESSECKKRVVNDINNTQTLPGFLRGCKMLPNIPPGQTPGLACKMNYDDKIHDPFRQQMRSLGDAGTENSSE